MSDPINTIEKDVKAIYTFTKSHIVLTVALAASLLFGIYTFDSKRAQEADTRAAIAQIQAQDAEKRATQADSANKQFQADAAQKEQAADTRVMQLQTEVDSLAKAMAARNVALGQQQKTDLTLPPTELGNRWSSLLKLAPGTVVYKDAKSGVDPNVTAFLVSPAAAVTTVQALESVPVLTQNVADLTKTVSDKNLQLTEKDTIITLKSAENGSNMAACELKVAAKELDIKAKDAVITQVKADARKKSLKYLLLGGILVEAIKMGLTHSL